MEVSSSLRAMQLGHNHCCPLRTAEVDSPIFLLNNRAHLQPGREINDPGSTLVWSWSLSQLESARLPSLRLLLDSPICVIHCSLANWRTPPSDREGRLFYVALFGIRGVCVCTKPHVFWGPGHWEYWMGAPQETSLGDLSCHLRASRDAKTSVMNVVYLCGLEWK